MHEFNNENFSKSVDTIALNFFSKKLKVKVIGGGKAATIKIKGFLEKGCFVEVISEEFSKDLKDLDSPNLKLIKGTYNINYINDGHIILIAINNEILVKEIIEHCENFNKIYIDSTNFKNGMGVIPCQREIDNISFSISTKVGVPKVSVMLAEKVKNFLKEYDKFTLLSSNIRKNAKVESNKKQIIDFVCSEDFKYIVDKNKEKQILQMFFGEDETSRLLNNYTVDKFKRK